jgi:hypothetical protein
MYAVVRISKSFRVETRTKVVGISKIVGCYKTKGSAEERANELNSGMDELRAKLNSIHEKPKAERTEEDEKFGNDYATNKMNEAIRYEVESIGFFK